MKTLCTWGRSMFALGASRSWWAVMLAGLLSALGISTAQAGPVGLWQFDSASGSTLLITPNAVPGGAPGVLINGAQIVSDTERGYVLETDGDNDYVKAGAIVQLLQSGTDFTWAFWAKQNSSQPVNSDVILG
ncbi:MAG TPA: hypothetical protein PLQ00_05135, partial [Thermoguttaceae bacterium]|nr:hypothetical protein [Thermoguttaceae bacterium]